MAIEVWIKRKVPEGAWTLYALPETITQAKAIVLARRQRDKQHDFEIRDDTSETADYMR